MASKAFRLNPPCSFCMFFSRARTFVWRAAAPRMESKENFCCFRANLSINSTKLLPLTVSL